MEEVLQHLRRPRTRNWFSAATGHSDVGTTLKYAIGTRLGSIYLVTESGQVRRKANVYNALDQRVERPLGTLTELAQTEQAHVVVEVTAQARLILMYCHRTIVALSPGSKLILLGPAPCVVFSRMERDSCSISHSRSQRLCSMCCPPPHHPLTHGDHIFLRLGRFGVRISANRHVIYCRSGMTALITRDNRLLPLETIVPQGESLRENKLTCFQ